MIPDRRIEGGSDRGFTLIEILVVLAILAAATAIAVPMFRVPGAASEIRRSVLVLANDLRLARAAALKSNAITFVDFDLGAGRYRAASAGADRALPAGVRLTVVTPVEEQTGPASGRVRFRADGSSSGATLTVAGDGAVARVDVDSFTGGVHVRW
jgi:general secretion pathway protein H